MPFGSPWLLKWSQFGTLICLISEITKTSILETPHTVWKGPGSQNWNHFAYFFNPFSCASFGNSPGSLFEGFWLHLGTQTGFKIDVKSYPNPAMITMWPQKVQVGLQLEPPGSQMVLKWAHKVPNGHQIGTEKMTQGNPSRFLCKGSAA